MSDPSLNDATVASYISIIGGHLYGGTIQTYPLATNQGKELWETEHYFDDDTIANIMALGKEVHDCMVTASMNAYVYWWITYGNGLATSSGTIYKRAYALGQFAKYIRPGYHRVDATASPATNLNVSAYTGDNNVVIVAVNTGSASVSQNFVLHGGTASQISSWQTTASANMATGQAYDATNGSFTASLPSQSITTFVGGLSGTSGTGGNTSTGGASGAGGKTGTGGSSATPGTGGGSEVGGKSGVGGATVTVTGGRSGVGGTSDVGGATVSVTGGRSGVGGTPSVGGATVTVTGGRSGVGGTSGVGGATVTAGVGGGVSSGGQGPSGSGGAGSLSGGATSLGSGGAATGSSNGGGAQGGTAGAVNDGTLTPPGESSGCSCVVAGKDARGLGGGIGAFLALCGLALKRRRASGR